MNKKQVHRCRFARPSKQQTSQPMPKFLKILLSLAMVMAVFYFTSTPSPTTTLVRLGFLAALIGFTLFSVIRRKGKDEDE